MQEVGWKGIELRDAAQYFKLTTYYIIVCLQASSNIFTQIYYWRDTFSDVFVLRLESVSLFQKELYCFKYVTICL